MNIQHSKRDPYYGHSFFAQVVKDVLEPFLWLLIIWNKYVVSRGSWTLSNMACMSVRNIQPGSGRWWCVETRRRKWVIIQQFLFQSIRCHRINIVYFDIKLNMRVRMAFAWNICISMHIFPFKILLLSIPFPKFSHEAKIFIVLYHWRLAMQHLMFALLWNRLYGARCAQ